MIRPLFRESPAMGWDATLALMAYGCVASVTPGPNNMMLLASGVNFGFLRTIPHLLGIAFGFLSLLLGVGFGLGALLKAYPELQWGLKIAGAGYTLFLAWKTFRARSLDTGRERARPMRFFEAAAFQWVNPKAWVLAVTAMALYALPESPIESVLWITATFTLVNLPSVACWAGCGAALRGFLSDPTRLKWFNITMGVLLAATLWPLLK
ncbi:MAG: LysE family translocator [Pirellulales bacterium]